MAEHTTSAPPRFDGTTYSSFTDEMKTAFKRDGVLVIENLVNHETCDKLISRMGELTEELMSSDTPPTIFSTKDQSHAKDEYFFESAGKISFFYEEDSFDENGKLIVPMEKAINKVGHALHDIDPIFSSFSRQPAFESICKGVGMKQPQIMQSMYIFKQAKVGGEVKMHQDGTFLWTDPLSVTGLWVALEDATLENGCLWGLPGDHVLPLQERFVRHEDGHTEMLKLNDYEFNVDKKVPLPVPKGSLVVIHGALPHMSLPNRSKKTRHAYTIHVVDGATDYPKNNWLQRPATMPPKGFSDVEKAFDETT